MNRSFADRKMGFRVSLALGALAVLALTGCPSPTPQVVEKAPVIKSFVATPGEVAPEEGVTLHWEVENATSVSVLQLGTGPVSGFDPAAQSGSVSLLVEKDTLFVLTARGPGGSDSQAAGVTVIAGQKRDVLFAAFPAEIAAGEASTLAWSAPGASEVSLVGPGNQQIDLGGKVTSGAIEVWPSTDATYVLTVDGVEHPATITVKPVIHHFTADVGAVTQNQTVRLSWQAGGAEKLTLSRIGFGVLVTAETAAQIADGSHEDTVPADLPDDGLVTWELTIEKGTQKVTRSLTLYVGVTPKVVSFQAPMVVFANSPFIASWTTAQADGLELWLDGKPVFIATSAAEVRQHGLWVPAPATTAAELELRLTNLRGGVASEKRLVEVLGPVQLVDFSADKTTVARGGEPVTLTWNVTNARDVKITSGGRTIVALQGKAAESGSVIHYPNETTTTYQLHADNTVGSTLPLTTLDVAVTTPAKVVYTPAPVPEGASVNATGHTVVGGDQLLGLPHVQKNVPGAAFVDIAGVGTAVTFSSPTTAPALQALPETFQTTIYGVPVSARNVAVSKLGFFVFSDTTKTAGTTQSPFPNTGLHPLAISPYWKNQVFGENSALLVHMDGPANDRRVIVQWEKVQLSGFPLSELTYQAQVYADGRVVFAYKTLQGLDANDGAVGVVNRDETAAVFPTSAPAEGDTFTFFGPPTFPFPTVASLQSYRVNVTLPTSTGPAFMELEGRPEVIPPRQIYFSEVNYFPAAAAPAGEWFELANPDNVPFDLDGWTIDFGNGQKHVITGPLTFPAHGVLVLGQSTDPAVNGGAPVDYAYGTGFSMPDTAGRIALVRYDTEYSHVAWSSGTEGVSMRADPPNPGLLYAPGVTQLTCGSASTYGTAGQTGTPGVRDARCFPYEMSFSPVGNFESIAATGQQIPFLDVDEALFMLSSTSTPALTHPVKWGYGTYDTMYVSTNAWVALRNGPDPTMVCASGTDCFKAQKNRTSFNPATNPSRLLALYWSDTEVQGGVYYQRMDPNPAIPGDEYTIISWENMRWGDTGTAYNMNWQVKFFETGDIEYHYGSMYAALNCTTNCGSSSTTWFEAEDGNAALVVNISSTSNPGIRENTAWRFTFTP